MGTEGGEGTAAALRSLSSRKSSSFQLRCSSLNALRLRRVFDLFDKNGDGLITIEEISQALVLLGLETDPSESALDSIIKSYIKPGNTGLTFEDFESLHRSLNETFFDCEDDIDLCCGEVQDNNNINEENKDAYCIEDDEDQVESDLTEAFKVFDVDGDGFISAKELQAVLDKLGMPEARDELDRIQLMINSVDRNQDGLVDFFEFKDMMRSVLVRSS